MTFDTTPLLVGDDARVRATAQRQWRDRRALERQLHDGAALRISALALRLGLLRHAIPAGVPAGSGPGSGLDLTSGELGAAVVELQDELHLVLQELRDVAGRLYPPLLDEAGLGPALREAAGRCPVPVHVDAPDERFGPAAEGAAYFALLGCLPQPYPRVDGAGLPGPIDIIVRRDDDALVLEVSGVDADHAASVRDGVCLLGGVVAVDDRVNDRVDDGMDAGVDAAVPAPITVRIPCA